MTADSDETDVESAAETGAAGDLETGAGSDAETDAGDGETASRSGGGPTCPRCDGELFKRHCKYVCSQHGVVFDCADTFWN